MGSACCANDDPNQTDQTYPDTKDRRPQKYEKKHSISTDSTNEFDINLDYPPSESSNNSTSFQPDASASAKAKTLDNVIDSFKNAVEIDNNCAVMEFVEKYPSLELLNVEFENGNNALHIAVNNKSYNLILYLLTNGISLNQQNYIGETALHSAVRINDLKIVTLLTKFEANTEIKNFKSETALIIAIDKQHDDIIELLSPQTQELVLAHLETENKINNDPFINLQRMKTKAALTQIRGISSQKNELPNLEAFLEKKQPTIPFQWQRRWVIVKDSYILWSDIRRNIIDTKNIKERKKFNNSINLMAITNIQKVTKSKAQRKFVIEVVGNNSVKNKKQQYLWRASTKTERDAWVKGLKEHIKHLKSIISFLGHK